MLCMVKMLAVSKLCRLDRMMILDYTSLTLLGGDVTHCILQLTSIDTGLSMNVPPRKLPSTTQPCYHAVDHSIKSSISDSTKPRSGFK